MKLINTLLAMTLSLGAMAQDQLGSGLQMANFDTTVNAGDDFYQFACGGWMKNNPLPAAYSRFGSFDQLNLTSTERVNTILKELLEGTFEVGSIEQKLSDFYKLAMDSVRLNAQGTTRLMPLLRELQEANTMAELRQVELSYPFLLPGSTFAFYFAADEKNAKENILSVAQSGLTLRQKEYYLDNDSATVAIRDAYKNYIVEMMRKFGYSKYKANVFMRNIINLETKIASFSKSRTELRDVEANYNKTTIYDFEKNYPAVPLRAYLNAKGIDDKFFAELVVGQPEFFAGLNNLLASIPTEVMRDCIIWNVVNFSASYLSDDVRTVWFEFWGKAMRGSKEDHPRWKRATSVVENHLGEALGKIYVGRYFPPEAKERMANLVKNLQISLGERIGAQTWMSDDTKKKAYDKLATFYVKIGYPDKWTDFSKLIIDPKKSYIENVFTCVEFEEKEQLSKTVGKPVDKDQWYMFPQTVNAYYNPTTNEICFPAGILQPPFFDMNADDAFNYGAIGVVIGHEMTHGFDDQGSLYDKEGNMNDWWTDADRKAFSLRGDFFDEFFSKIKVLPDLSANGRLTLGENLADHGGLQVAFNAYKNATKDAPLGEKDGFTADQRFFLSYAGVWAQNITEAEIRNRTKSDPHSLGEWRVNGALPHIDAWYEAFGVKKTNKLFLEKKDRLELW